MSPRYKLTLFVTPDSSGKALRHLYTALSELSYNDYELEIVDALKEPDKAQKANIIGTPGSYLPFGKWPGSSRQGQRPETNKANAGDPPRDNARVARRQHRDAT